MIRRAVVACWVMLGALTASGCFGGGDAVGGAATAGRGAGTASPRATTTPTPRSLGVEPVTPIDLRLWPTATATITAVDPPAGFGEGREIIRGDLALFRPSDARPRTTSIAGTIEAVVQRGEVMLVREAPTPIPRDGFVVAGAGAGGEWVRAHLPVGTVVAIEGDRLVARRGVGLHLAAVERAIAETQRRLEAASEGGVDRARRQRADAQVKAATEQLTLARGAMSRAASLEARANVGTDGASLRPQAAAERDRALDQLGTALAHAIAGAAALAPSTSHEWRVAWYRPTDPSARRIRDDLEAFATAQINTLVVDVHFDGRTIYPSRREHLLQHEAFRGQDPIPVILETSRRLGLRVIAASSVLRLGTDRFLPILQKQPTWWAIDRSGRAECALEDDAVFLSPSSPEAMEWVLGHLRELATMYGFDGLMLTGLRLPSATDVAHEFDYSAAARGAFLKLAAEDPLKMAPHEGPLWGRWEQFRRDQTTALLQGIRKELRRVKPEMSVGVSVLDLATSQRLRLAQEWDLWAEAGLVDWVVVQPAGGAAGWVESARVALAEAAAARSRPLVVRAPDVVEPTPLALVDRLVALRRLDGSSGVLLDASLVTPSTARLLRQGPFRDRAEPILEP